MLKFYTFTQNSVNYNYYFLRLFFRIFSVTRACMLIFIFPIPVQNWSAVHVGAESVNVTGNMLISAFLLNTRPADGYGHCSERHRTLDLGENKMRGEYCKKRMDGSGSALPHNRNNIMFIRPQFDLVIIKEPRTSFNTTVTIITIIIDKNSMIMTPIQVVLFSVFYSLDKTEKKPFIADCRQYSVFKMQRV